MTQKYLDMIIAKPKRKGISSNQIFSVHAFYSKRQSKGTVSSP